MKRLLEGAVGAHPSATETSDGINTNGNKMRPGAFYVDKRNDQFRYVDKDGTEQWLVPSSCYIASETIKRGEAISIDSRETEPSTSVYKNIDAPTIHRTDPDLDQSCLGLALNYAEAGQLVHVQSKGTFRFRTLADADEEYVDGKTISDKEVLMPYEYSEVRGQRLFVSKADADEDRGKFTYNFIDSVYRAKNTIQIGYLTDAPLTPGHQKEVWLELDVTGDTRGPLENTQYLIELGEDMTITKENQFKVIALGRSHASEPHFRINVGDKLKTLLNDKNAKAFIGIRKSGNDSSFAHIIALNCNLTVEELRNNTKRPIDAGFARFTTDQYMDPENPLENIIISKVTLDATADLDDLKDELGAAIKDVLNERSESAWIFNKDATSILVESTSPAAFYELYLSEDVIENGIYVEDLDHGSFEVAGKAILADVRSDERSHVLGVYCGGGIGTHPKGEVITVMRAGTFFLTAKQESREVSSRLKNPSELTEDDYTFKNGATYYLGINGGVYRDLTHLYFDRSIQIGQQIGDNEAGTRIIVNIGDITQSYDGSLPLGYVKASVKGQPEYGYKLCDGATPLSKDDYPDAYNFLISTHSRNQIEVYDENGNPTRSFKIPEMYTFASGVKEIAQMKVLPKSIYHEIPRLPFIRASGKIENRKVADIDITRLIQYGTIENGMVAPTLDNIDIRLYVRDAKESIPNGAWREIPAGYSIYNNMYCYGYDWIVDETAGNRFILQMAINDGLGVSVVSGSQPPVSLNDYEYMVVVTKRDIWKREYKDIDVLGKTILTKDMHIASEELAPTVSAVLSFYKELVDTEHLKVGQFFEIVDGKITSKKAEINLDDVLKIVADEDGKYHALAWNETTNTYESYLFKGDLDKHEAKSIVDSEVHGIKNTGATGNLNAQAVAGYQVGTSEGVVSTNNEAQSKAFIPFVDADGKLSIKDKVSYSGNVVESVASSKDGTTKSLEATTDKVTLDIHKDTDKYNGVKAEVDLSENSVDLDASLKAKKLESPEAAFESLQADAIQIGDKDLGAYVQGIVGRRTNSEEASESTSSIAYKDVLTEYLVENGYAVDLKANVPGSEVELEASDINNALLTTVGQALQALFETPIAEFKYLNDIATYGNDKAKKMLGILVERANKASDYWKINTESDYEIQKGNVATEPFANIKYTEDEAAQISESINKLTGSNELTQNILSSVGLLIKAAQETQGRLMDLESSVYGFDSDKLPGGRESFNEDPAKISEDLKDMITSTPLLLGLNRIVKAICLEVFNTSELDAIESEIMDNDPSTEGGNKGKVTILSRLDMLDKYLGQQKNFLTWYIENHFTQYTEHLLDQDPTWKDVLPNDEDFEKPLAAYKATPNKVDHTAEEMDKIEVPSVGDDSSKLLETDEDGNFVTTEIEGLWLDERVDRIQKTLLKIVKDLYGSDTVLAEKPNRIDVLNHDVDLIINALWNTSGTGLELSYNGGKADDKMYEDFGEHTSITDILENELFEYTIKSGALDKRLKALEAAHADLGSTEFEVDANNITFSVQDNLDGDYADNYSIIDMIADKLGLVEALKPALLESGSVATLLTGGTPVAAKSHTVLGPVYLDDLSYSHFEKQGDDEHETYAWVKAAGLDGFDVSKDHDVISRKEKTYESRITTVESYLDFLSSMLNDKSDDVIKNGFGKDTLFESAVRANPTANSRFEENSVASFGILSEDMIEYVNKISHYVENAYLPNQILKESFEDEDLAADLSSKRYTLDSLSFEKFNGSKPSLAQTIFNTLSSKEDAKVYAVSAYTAGEDDKPIIIAFGKDLNLNDSNLPEGYYIHNVSAANDLTAVNRSDLSISEVETDDNSLLDMAYNNMAMDIQANDVCDVLLNKKINKAISNTADLISNVVKQEAADKSEIDNAISEINEHISGHDTAAGNRFDSNEDKINELIGLVNALSASYKDLQAKYNALVEKLYNGNEVAGDDADKTLKSESFTESDITVITKPASDSESDENENRG